MAWEAMYDYVDPAGNSYDVKNDSYEFYNYIEPIQNPGPTDETRGK